jgi:hypothetical protein
LQQQLGRYLSCQLQIKGTLPVPGSSPKTRNVFRQLQAWFTSAGLPAVSGSILHGSRNLSCPQRTFNFSELHPSLHHHQPPRRQARTRNRLDRYSCDRVGAIILYPNGGVGWGDVVPVRWCGVALSVGPSVQRKKKSKNKIKKKNIAFSCWNNPGTAPAYCHTTSNTASTYRQSFRVCL